MNQKLEELSGKFREGQFLTIEQLHGLIAGQVVEIKRLHKQREHFLKFFHKKIGLYEPISEEIISILDEVEGEKQ